MFIITGSMMRHEIWSPRSSSTCQARRAVSWDVALRGVHFDATRALGLVESSKVNKTAARKGNKI